MGTVSGRGNTVGHLFHSNGGFRAMVRRFAPEPASEKTRVNAVTLAVVEIPASNTFLSDDQVSQTRSG